MRRALCLALCLLCLLPAALAEGQFVVGYVHTPRPRPSPVPAQRPEAFQGYPKTNDQGFLDEPLSKDKPAFIHVDRDAGRWIYISTDLNIDIERRMIKTRAGSHYYFIAHILYGEGQAFRSYRKNPRNPVYDLAKPEAIARQHGVIYAQNGDLFSYRVYNKKFPGVIIRDGKILYDRTYNKANVNAPPLDELSLYPDGRVEMHIPGEVSAQDYLSKGATDVFSFGPILLKDSEKDPRLVKDFRSPEPRSAIGIVGPGHLVGIMAEGRNKRSKGVPLSFVADRLLEEGCTDAFTLDGGQTAAMVFMGTIVMDPGTYSGYTKTRQQPDIVGIGVTRQKP